MEHPEITKRRRKNITIEPRWPRYNGEGGLADEFSALAGATIVRIGTPVGLNLEGGGLAIEYIPAGATEHRTVMFEFSEVGLWHFGYADSVPTA